MRSLNKYFLHTILFLAAFSLVSCKSEYDRIRLSGDENLILKKADDYFSKEEYLKAQTLYEQVITRFRGRPEAEGMYFKYAYTQYYLKNYILSSYYFDNYSNTFRNSKNREEAVFMSAYSNYKLSPSFRLDQTYTEKAIESFQNFANTFPESPRIAECNKLMDECRAKLEKKSFMEGQLYYDIKNYQSSNHVFENLLKDFPETREAEKVRYLIVKSSFLLAENSVYEKKRERFEEALNKSEAFLTRYPSSKYKKDIFDIKVNSQKKLKEHKI